MKMRLTTIILIILAMVCYVMAFSGMAYAFALLGVFFEFAFWMSLFDEKWRKDKSAEDGKE